MRNEAKQENADTALELVVPHDDFPDRGFQRSDEPRSEGEEVGRAEAVYEPWIDPHAEGLSIANWWLKARRLREDMFGPGLFADPAWDILLDLYTAEARGKCVQTSSLAIAARVPHSTAIRWAKIMTQAGLIVRHKDPQDARRVHVRLSPSARALMEDFLARLSQHSQVPSSILVEPPR